MQYHFPVSHASNTGVIGGRFYIIRNFPEENCQLVVSRDNNVVCIGGPVGKERSKILQWTLEWRNGGNFLFRPMLNLSTYISYQETTGLYYVTNEKRKEFENHERKDLFYLRLATKKGLHPVCYIMNRAWKNTSLVYIGNVPHLQPSNDVHHRTQFIFEARETFDQELHSFLPSKTAPSTSARTTDAAVAYVYNRSNTTINVTFAGTIKTPSSFLVTRKRQRQSVHEAAVRSNVITSSMFDDLDYTGFENHSTSTFNSSEIIKYRHTVNIKPHSKNKLVHQLEVRENYTISGLATMRIFRKDIVAGWVRPTLPPLHEKRFNFIETLGDATTTIIALKQRQNIIGPIDSINNTYILYYVNVTVAGANLFNESLIVETEDIDIDFKQTCDADVDISYVNETIT